MYILVKTAETIELCRGSCGSCGCGEGGTEECGWLSDPSSSTEELGNLKFLLTTSACQLTWPSSMANNTAGWDCTVVLPDWELSGMNIWNQTERLFHSPSDGVVWLRVCGSSGNNEMLACWNMRNHTNITATFIPFSIKREIIISLLCFIKIKMTLL